MVVDATSGKTLSVGRRWIGYRQTPPALATFALRRCQPTRSTTKGSKHMAKVNLSPEDLHDLRAEHTINALADDGNEVVLDGRTFDGEDLARLEAGLPVVKVVGGIGVDVTYSEGTEAGTASDEAKRGVTQLAAKLVDRHVYSQANLIDAIRLFNQSGDMDAAADRIAERELGPNWRRIVADTDAD